MAETNSLHRESSRAAVEWCLVNVNVMNHLKSAAYKYNLISGPLHT